MSRRNGRFSDSSPRVVVRLAGGLGNQLFQYAFGRRMAVANGAELILDASGYQKIDRSDARLGIRGLGLQHFNIQATIDTESWVPSSELPDRPWIKRKFLKWSRLLARLLLAPIPHHLQPLVREPQRFHFTFDRAVYNRSIKGSVVFEGYWQTEKYFLEVEPLIRKELAVREPMGEENAGVAAKIRSADSIAVHVRHGDNASGIETGLGVLPRTFYEKAIRELQADVRNPRFFVFSDDIGWARSLLQPGIQTEFVAHNDDMHNYEDLRLMSMCRHHIVANSTFSWWGAWLGKKAGQIVFAPRRYWLNVDRPNPDLYPGHWRLI